MTTSTTTEKKSETANRILEPASNQTKQVHHKRDCPYGMTCPEEMHEIEHSSLFSIDPFSLPEGAESFDN